VNELSGYAFSPLREGEIALTGAPATAFCTLERRQHSKQAR